jgi:hypothetical protein
VASPTWSSASPTGSCKTASRLFTTVADLIDDPSAASRDGRLREALARYLKPHVLVVDDVGYPPAPVEPARLAQQDCCEVAQEPSAVFSRAGERVTDRNEDVTGWPCCYDEREQT